MARSPMSCPKPVSTYLVNMDLSAITSFFAMRSPWRRMLTCDTYTSMLNIILEWYNLHAYVHPEPPSGQCPLPLQHQSSPDRHRVAARGTCWAMSHPRRNTTAEGNFCNACRTIYRASNLAHMLPLDIQYMLLPCMLDGLARPCFRAAPWSHPFPETQVHTSAFLVHSAMMHAKDAGKASRTHAATCQYTFKSSCPLVAHEVISRSLWQTREFLNYCNDILHISELSITCLLTALAHTLQQHTQSSGVASAALLSDPLSMCCCPSLSFSCPPFVIISGSFAPCCLDSSMAHCSIPNSRMGHHNLLRSCRSTLQLPLLLQCSQVATSGGVLPLLPLLLLWLLLAPHLPRLCLCTQCLQITASNARIGCPL